MRFSYPERELFAHWSAAIAPGVTLVRGGDGRGKSTLLRLFAGAQAADAGQLQINAVRLDEQPAAYRRQVFWVDPRSDAFEHTSVLDYFRSLPGLYPQFDELALPGLIEGLSLAPHLEKFFYMLSTGSKRKVWLAAAFASGTPLALLDEPFAGLDKVSINFVLALLTQAAQGSRAWVLADYQAPGSVPLAATIDLGD
ncbi:MULTISPECIES: ABC transporter ATP-binding protein [unclassified Janthinobacterium]|uniref:ABC transporter ATP-binding protein n=1 Tax=unclassified Janthinobacterium TaxID=2610881 RepID=UPI000348A731|nr:MULTISPECIES: ATP-binding cassette domain-containing protein [unclassified Janthinobacterium]MEC5161765.1 ABC-type multidrug transport system ATPase subunit [Janthinobacterium sp. CG_S6]